MSLENYPEFIISKKSGELYQVVKVKAENETKKREPVKKVAKSVRYDDSDDELQTKKRKSSSKSDEKSQKKPKKPVVEAAPEPAEEESEDENETLEKASGELLSDEQMQAETFKEHQREFRRCMAYKKWYEKTYKNKDKKVTQVDTANEYMKNAAATLAKVKGLENATFSPESHLLKAIPKLKESGVELYKKCIDLIATFSPEELEQFWKKQIRNKDATCFEDLITVKEYDKRKLADLIAKAAANSTADDVPSVVITEVVVEPKEDAPAQDEPAVEEAPKSDAVEPMNE
jgi:hypothetical protein